MDNSGLLKAVDVEQRGTTLQIRLRKGFDAEDHNTDWAKTIIRSCVGPYETVIVDLSHLPNVSSTFFAGAMQLLEAYRSGGCTEIVLLNVADRTVRTIDMLKLRELFVIRQHEG